MNLNSNCLTTTRTAARPNMSRGFLSNKFQNTKNQNNMKTFIKSLLLVFVSVVLISVDAAAQKVAAAAVADQHYAAQTANYKLMMIALAGVYGIYLFLRIRRKREMDRILGNNA